MTLILTLVFAFLVNYLLLFYEFGLGLFILVSAYIGYLSYALYINKELTKQWAIKVVVSLLLIIPFVIRDIDVFKILTFLGLPFWLAIFSIEMDPHALLGEWKPIIITTFRPFTKFHLLIKNLIERIFKGRESLKYVMLGIIIVVPLLLIIIPLLIEADVIFKKITISLLESIHFSSEVVFRIIFCTIIGSYAYGQVMLPLLKKIKNVENESRSESQSESQSENLSIVQKTAQTQKSMTITLNTVLVSVNIIYILFVYIQVRYLFLNQGGLPDGITYAGYAREGFFQLLTVTIINVGLVILLEFLNRNKHTLQRILEGLTLTCTWVMAFSAFYRMHLYETEYGYTRLRLLVFMFLIFIILFIGLLLAYIGSYKQGVINIMIVFAGVYYIGSSWFNVDDFVVRQNIDRYQRTGIFDSRYAMSLSEDALDRLILFEQENPEAFEKGALGTDSYYLEAYKTFDEHLKLIAKIREKQSWQSYNLSQYWSK